MIVGIDPGTRVCGYGVITSEGKYVTSGIFKLSTNKPLHVRLRELHEGLREIFEEYEPHEAVVEKVFFAKNVKSALSLGHARGVVLLAAAEREMDLFEYSPLEVKKAVTGYGRAEKSQVQEMVRSVLALEHRLAEDSADALALALCHKNQIWLQGVRTA